MRKVAFGSERKETPLVVRRISKILVTISTTIAGYGLTAGIEWLGFVGLGCAVVGSVLPDLFYVKEAPTCRQ